MDERRAIAIVDASAYRPDPLTGLVCLVGQNWVMDASDWDGRYGATDLVWSAGPNAFLVAETEELPAAKALDIACGEGRNSIWLAQRGWQVTAVDFSRVGVAKGRARAEELHLDVEWHVADMTGWRPPTKFDLVTILYLQLPAEERRSVLASAVEALRPGATLLVVAHALRNLADGFGGPQDPAVLTDAATVADEIKSVAPEIVVEKAIEVDRQVDTPYGQRSAIDLLVRARSGLG